ncbi:polysaccharide biosynthesis tyrosine autokinase [Pragia fontium]|uniref:polysaccharide biosynthesis tyrosine autokinase n=1 Tax=Pragia fontium TaxID=82985 RepID=UPI000649AC3E|nr:polysaccharide biosynthesis tyrosine autokinase [Pragia fontium]AKJ43441.1 tyrosine protein kinase [Pragia fontium]
MVSTQKNVNNNWKENGEIHLGKIIGTIVDHKKFILIITLFCTTIAIFYSLLATPIYRADVLIQIEKNTQDNILSNFSDILSDDKPQSAAEMELLKSRMVMGKTIDDLNLDIQVSEKSYPIIGRVINLLQKKQATTIVVSKLEIPESIYDEELILTVLPNDHYKITSNNIEINGQVGVIKKQNEYTILISDIDAAVGTEFRIKRLDKITAVNNLLANFSVSDTTKDSGVLKLNFKGRNKHEIRKILDNISNNYLQQNIERKSAEAAKSLDFLNQQLPLIKQQLEEAEGKLNQFRQTHESVDLNLEAKSTLESTVAITSQLNEAIFKEAEISKLYTKEHPAYRSLLEKKEALLQEKNILNQRIANLPKTQQEILRLTRDVQSGQEIYVSLLNKQQELNINKASKVGNVRIIDKAVTQPDKIKPNPPVIIGLAFILSLLLSIALILGREYFRRFINDSTQLESLNINIYANIPLSKAESKKNKEIQSDKNTNHIKLLAVKHPTDPAIEAIRSLRTALHFASQNTLNRILMVIGATPGVGKSFVSSNLAAVVANSGKKVLLIDADMRKGSLHKSFGRTPENGLSDILSNRKEIADCLYNTPVEGLDFLPRGTVPHNPSELLMNEYLAELLLWANSHYDLVIMDPPPTLATTDSTIIGKYSGMNIIIVRFEKNTISEIESSIKRLEQSGAMINGVVLNAIQKRAAKHYSDGSYEYYIY